MIIGLAGKKGSGKNTIADIIEKEFANYYLVCQWAFATDLKLSAMRALGMSDFSDLMRAANEIKNDGKIEVTVGNEKFAISGREYLQFYGDEAHRQVFGSDFWVDNLITKIRKARRGWDFYDCLDIITDVRFPNEAEMIHVYDGVVINIVRPSLDNQEDNHASENGLPERCVDVHLMNDQDLLDMRSIVRDLVQDILEWRK